MSLAKPTLGVPALPLVLIGKVYVAVPNPGRDGYTLRVVDRTDEDE